MSEGPYDDLPTWEELQDVRTWIMMGCPAAQRDIDPREMVQRLWKLMEGLPHHLPIYAWGAPEWKAELARQRGLQVDLVRVKQTHRKCEHCQMLTPFEAHGMLHNIGCPELGPKEKP